MSSDKSKKPFQETPMAGALVAGVFSLVAIILGFYLVPQLSKSVG